jgi:hypothetical protein
MTPKTLARRGMALAKPAHAMRLSLLWVLPALALVPAVAHAQDAGTTTTLPAGWLVTRQPSSRSAELGRPLTVDDGIGLRDCACGEIWEIKGTFQSPPPNGSMQAQFWVGQSSDDCSTQLGRGQTGTMKTCFSIMAPGFTLFPLGGSNNFDVFVSAGFLLNPTTGQCTTPLGTTAGTLFYNAVYLAGSVADPLPTQNFQVTYKLDPPVAATNVAASAQENGAQVTWTGAGTTTDDSGTSITTLPAGFRGYFVVVDPPPPVPLFADASVLCDGPGLPDTGSTSDASDAGDATDDLADMAVAETGSDAASEASTDAGTDAGTGMDASADGGVCLPPPVFNPNDDTQFNARVVSQLVTTNSVNVQGLQNGVAYRFAVVTEDLNGNRSVSAFSDCATPQPVTDLWEQIHNRGGTIQPGFCSARPGPVGGIGFAGSALGVVGAIAALRRRRRARRDAPRDGGAQ